MFITFGSHRKLDPGRRCPRQPHIVNKEGRSYAVTNPWCTRMAPRRNGGRNARGGASDANGAEVVTEAERRAQELGAAMLNAARPFIDVTLDRQGYPLAIQPRDFFTFMEAHAAFNNRTPNVTEKALVLEGMSTRVKDFCLSFKGLRNAMQDEDDVDEKPLLEYDPAWDPKTEAGRKECLKWDENNILPALRKQFTFKGGKSEHEAIGEMLKGIDPRKDGTDWAQIRMLLKAFQERREQEGGESSEADNLQLIKWVLEALKPKWPSLCEWMKKLPKKDQPTDVIAWVDEMSAMSEEFLQMANGAMHDYCRFLTDKSTSKDKPAQDSGVKSNNQGVRFDNNAVGTSKANDKGTKGTKKRHDPDILCLRCDEPGHIARYCTNKGKTPENYPRSASQQSDRGGGKGGGKGKDEKKGSVSAATAAGTTSAQEWEEFQEFKEFKAKLKSTGRK